MTRQGQEIDVGDVFFLRCNLCNPPKPKFFVVAQVSPLRMFLINSKLTEWAKQRPEHINASPVITQKQHAFLQYDSYLCCTAVSHEYSFDILIQMLSEDGSIKRGSLHKDARRLVYQALHDNRLIERKYLRPIRELWQQYQ